MTECIGVCAERSPGKQDIAAVGPDFGSFVALPPPSHKHDIAWPWEAVSSQTPCAHSFRVGEESVCPCAQHALAEWRSPLFHSAEAHFLNLPGLDVCGSFELQGALAKAAWSPTTCTAAMTVMWSRRGMGQPLGLFLVACGGACPVQAFPSQVGRPATSQWVHLEPRWDEACRAGDHRAEQAPAGHRCS